MLEVVKLEVGDEKSIFELWWSRLEEVLEPSFHLFSMTMTFNNADFNENDDGVLLVQTSKISPRLIAFQFSNYQNIYSGYTRLWEGLYNMSKLCCFLFLS